ncbi:hypothetical protein Aglo01_65960 [Actinokineospora globicatena]|nr:hypothetical protein Aglo01_65960 [Actinokineospora globicatena]GLW88908.1 hypothetical protein Aglo02_65470 [Actinokineospora globicatena]
MAATNNTSHDQIIRPPLPTTARGSVVITSGLRARNSQSRLPGKLPLAVAYRSTPDCSWVGWALSAAVSTPLAAANRSLPPMTPLACS